MVGIYTNKQKWRHQPIRKRIRKNFLENQEVPPRRSLSEMSIQSNGSMASGRMWATTGDLRYSTSRGLHSSSNKSIVRFSPAVRVVLIPTIDEYNEANLSHLIWWVESDFKEFKKSALLELKNYLIDNPGLGAKKAAQILYQPSDEKDSSNNSSNSIVTIPEEKRLSLDDYLVEQFQSALQGSVAGVNNTVSPTKISTKKDNEIPSLSDITTNDNNNILTNGTIINTLVNSNSDIVYNKSQDISIPNNNFNNKYNNWSKQLLNNNNYNKLHVKSHSLDDCTLKNNMKLNNSNSEDSIEELPGLSASKTDLDLLTDRNNNNNEYVNNLLNNFIAIAANKETRSVGEKIHPLALMCS